MLSMRLLPIRNMLQRLFPVRPRALQAAALCYRGSGEDTRILLLTSRGTGRWIIPKGWPMKDRDSAGTARQEAWEEAGVEGEIAPRPIGSYSYDKILDSGLPLPCQATVYPLRVDVLHDEFPELGQRERVWVTPEEAAARVDEPGLKRILAGFRAPVGPRRPVTGAQPA